MKLVTDDGKEHDIAFEKVDRVDLDPGDIIMIHLKGQFDEATHDRIATMFKRMFPDNQLILTEWGTEIEIIRKDKTQ